MTRWTNKEGTQSSKASNVLWAILGVLAFICAYIMIYKPEMIVELMR